MKNANTGKISNAIKAIVVLYLHTFILFSFNLFSQMAKVFNSLLYGMNDGKRPLRNNGMFLK